VTDEDQDWLDALASRTPTGQHRAAIREGERLRTLIQRNVHAPDVTVPEQDAERETQLLERARREGLIDPPELAKRARRRLRPAAVGGWLGLAASVAGIAVALTFFLRSSPPIGHVRGARAPVIHLEAPDPTALKMQILDELHAAGVHATGYEQLGVEGIDASLPNPVPPRVKEVLTRHHLNVPSNGVLRIEIASPSQP
jgi:hypothetical protein